MKPEELRIGNYVFINGRIVIVNAIIYNPLLNKIKITVVNKLGEVPISPIGEIIKPIPLTEDLLLKCGFEKLICYKLDDIYIDCNNGGFWVMIGGIGGKAINIKYLHQLQNLYFSLTGKELEIKL